MICVTIGRGRHSSLSEEWEAAAKAGTDLVELRIDCLRRDPDLKRILKHRPTPMVFTIRRGVDGGLWRGNEEKRLQLIREAIALGVDYVDLEQDIAGKIRRFGKTKRIVSYHNLKTTPTDVQDVAEKSDELDPDIVKVATSALTLGDASRVLHLAVTGKFPTIPIAMGEIGVFSRILGAKFGSPFTYAGFNPERVFAPGMPQLAVLKKDYFYNEIDSRTEVYGVIGDPIEQSLSPAVHNAAFRHLGLNKVLVPILVPVGELETFFRELLWLEIKGCSVTIPHKEEIVTHLQQKEGAVERTGSCNTIVFDADGRRIGYNTDYRAAMDSIEAAMGGGAGGDEDAVSPLLDKQVLILGAGGVARSIAFGLMRRGAHLTVTNRHDERATSLAEEVGCRMITWSQRNCHCRCYRQLHSGRHAPEPGRYTAAPRGVSAARHRAVRHGLPPREHDAPEAGTRAPGHDHHRRGHVPSPGRPAVQDLHGARRSARRHERHFETKAGADSRRMTLDPIRPRHRASRGPGLVLVGYRGTGKTTVGKILADRLNLRFLDADLEIEARAGRSIVSIFTEAGETVFRDWEERTLGDLVRHHPGAVLASGGGAVLRPSNRRLLLDFGFVVWLRAEPAELARRLEADRQAGTERPALTSAGTVAEIAQVLSARAPLYEETADIAIETRNRAPDEVAALILDLWRP